MAFSDDAYNKSHSAAGPGTLVGNWSEELVLRASCGEGRSVPQRHVPRSGLLKDFTKVPAETRKGDNTFERVYGPKGEHAPVAASSAYGAFSGQDQAQSSAAGPQVASQKDRWLRLAESEVQEEETVQEGVRNARCFDTASGTAFAKPDLSNFERPKHLRVNRMQDLYQAPPKASRGKNAHQSTAEIPSSCPKASIHAQIAEALGPHGYIMLRQRLFDFGDSEGFVEKSDVVAVLRNELGLSTETVSDEPLDVYLSGLATEKKSALKIDLFMASLRPALTQKDTNGILQLFSNLKPVGGCVRLGDWLGMLTSEELRNTIVSAFGGQDEEEVAETALTEPVFVELFSDLAAIMDISPMLPAA